MPATWGSIGKAMNSAMRPFVKIAAATSVMNARLKAAPTFMGKLRVIAQSVVGVVDKIAKGAFSIAKNIGKATLSLLKWAGLTSIFTGLMGGVGLFGLDRLAGAAANSRRQSQGLGVDPGDLKSAQVNFSKFADVDSTLENIANARADLSKRWIFSALGVNPEAGSNVDVMSASLKAAKHSFERGGLTQQNAEAHGLTQLYSMDDLRRLHQMTDQEIDDAVRKQNADREALRVNDETLRGWQDLRIQLDKAGSQIEAILIKKLSGLSGPLATLSGAVADAIGTLAGDKDLPGYIQTFGDKIKQFAKYLASDEFKSDMDNFIDRVKKVGSALGDLFGWIYDKLKFLGIVKSDATPSAPGEAPKKQSDWDKLTPTTLDKVAWNVQQVNKKMLGGEPPYYKEIERKNGLPPGSLGRIQSTEFSGKDLSKAVSPVGAKGPFQFMGGTAKQYGLTDPFSLQDSANAAGRMLGDLMRKYHGNFEKAAAAYNWGAGNIDKDLAANGDQWKAHLPRETRDYITKTAPSPTNLESGRSSGTQQRGSTSVHVEVRNNTGGSAIVTTNALAH
jgi:hypothetical protein